MRTAAAAEAAIGGRSQHATPPEPARQEHGLSATLVFGHGAAAPISALFLLPVVAMGLEMFRRWHRDRKEGGVVGPDVQETPADAHLSPALVYMHGLAAAVTVLLVIVAAVRVA